MGCGYPDEIEAPQFCDGYFVSFKPEREDSVVLFTSMSHRHSAYREAAVFGIEALKQSHAT
jgi:hypothetical protein